MGATVALLLAAGTGSRLGGQPKAFVDLAGIPMFMHSYRAIVESGRVDEVVVLVPAGQEQDAKRFVRGADAGVRFTIRAGGVTRGDSVQRGLEALRTGTDSVVCHDAARPFASVELFRRVLSGLHGVHGVVPVVPSPDTVKRVSDRMVVETLPRDELGLVQTPQAFSADALAEAHARAGKDAHVATDDAMLLEAAGFRVSVVDGEPANFKITTPDDLRRAEAFLRELAEARGVPGSSR